MSITIEASGKRPMMTLEEVVRTKAVLCEGIIRQIMDVLNYAEFNVRVPLKMKSINFKDKESGVVLNIESPSEDIRVHLNNSAPSDLVEGGLYLPLSLLTTAKTIKTLDTAFDVETLYRFSVVYDCKEKNPSSSDEFNHNTIDSQKNSKFVEDWGQINGNIVIKEMLSLLSIRRLEELDVFMVVFKERLTQSVLNAQIGDEAECLGLLNQKAESLKPEDRYVWIPESLRQSGVYVRKNKLDGKYYTTYNVYDALYFETKEECEKWCNNNDIVGQKFMTVEHAFMGEPPTIEQQRERLTNVLVTKLENKENANDLLGQYREIYVNDMLRQMEETAKENTRKEYAYAKRLAESLWKKYYQKEAPKWQPFNDTIGLLTQIDNMVTGLEKKHD